MSEAATNLPTLGGPTDRGFISPYASAASFETAQRMALALSKSTMVPSDYRESVANCLVAMELANRVGASVLAVMQNSDVINGRPAWRATFVIAAINTCGKFEPLRFRLEGEGDERACVAWTKDREGNLIEGPAVSVGLARAEGWLTRKGSKWKTMPDVMLRYRAATFFGRLYASEVLMGMQTTDEAVEVLDATRTADGTYEVQSGVDGLKDALQRDEPQNGPQDGQTAQDAADAKLPTEDTTQPDNTPQGAENSPGEHAEWLDQYGTPG